MAVGWGHQWGRHWGKASLVIIEVTHVYTRQIATAIRMIKAKGQLCVWVKQNEVISSTQPWKASYPGNPTTYPVRIVFFPPGGVLSEEMQHLEKGTSVDQGSPRALMASVPFTPEMNDKVLRGNEWLDLKGIDIVAPNGEVILYKLRFA